jgi:glycogen debranching enzyme
MKTDRLLREAHERATDILQRCATSQGFRGSALNAGYPQIWAPDSAITALGAVVTGSETMLAAIRASLDTLAQFQSETGLIPLNVNPENGYISAENAGALDSNLWYVLLHYLHWLRSGDMDYLCRSWSSIDRAINWLTYQDMNECGLLETPEAAFRDRLMVVDAGSHAAGS